MKKFPPKGRYETYEADLTFRLNQWVDHHGNQLNRLAMRFRHDSSVTASDLQTFEERFGEEESKLAREFMGEEIYDEMDQAFLQMRQKESPLTKEDIQWLKGHYSLIAKKVETTSHKTREHVEAMLSGENLASVDIDLIESSQLQIDMRKLSTFTEKLIPLQRIIRKIETKPIEISDFQAQLDSQAAAHGDVLIEIDEETLTSFGRIADQIGFEIIAKLYDSINQLNQDHYNGALTPDTLKQHLLNIISIYNEIIDYIYSINNAINYYLSEQLYAPLRALKSTKRDIEKQFTQQDGIMAKRMQISLKQRQPLRLSNAPDNPPFTERQHSLKIEYLREQISAIQSDEEWHLSEYKKNEITRLEKEIAVEEKRLEFRRKMRKKSIIKEERNEAKKQRIVIADKMEKEKSVALKYAFQAAMYEIINKQGQACLMPADFFSSQTNPELKKLFNYIPPAVLDLLEQISQSINYLAKIGQLRPEYLENIVATKCNSILNYQEENANKAA